MGKKYDIAGYTVNEKGEIMGEAAFNYCKKEIQKYQEVISALLQRIGD